MSDIKSLISIQKVCLSFTNYLKTMGCYVGNFYAKYFLKEICVKII